MPTPFHNPSDLQHLPQLSSHEHKFDQCIPGLIGPVVPFLEFPADRICDMCYLLLANYVLKNHRSDGQEVIC